MNWRLIALIPALALAGCSLSFDSPRFKDANEFFDYIDALKLNRMSITEASNRLAGEGYICNASGLTTICTATEKLLTCKDTSSITLAPYDKHQISVREKYSTLCI